MSYLLIIVSAIFVNNVVLSQFLGICPFLGVSKRISTAIGMTDAVTFVVGYLQTISFILVIAALVQLVEIVLKKVSPPLYQALGVFLPLITTNCAILGVAIMTISKELNILVATVFSMATAIGFGLALIVFAGIREKLDLVDIPKGMKGAPVALVVAGILALAFMGFAGMV